MLLIAIIIIAVCVGKMTTVVGGWLCFGLLLFFALSSE